MKPDIIDEKLISEVKGSISDNNSRYLSKLIESLRPADLTEYLKQEERIYLFDMLEPAYIPWPCDNFSKTCMI